MGAQGIVDNGRAEREARNFLLGIPPRMLQEASDTPAGSALVGISHAQLATLSLCPGDRVYLGAFSDRKLALIGRIEVDVRQTDSRETRCALHGRRSPPVALTGSSRTTSPEDFDQRQEKVFGSQGRSRTSSIQGLC